MSGFQKIVFKQWLTSLFEQGISKENKIDRIYIAINFLLHGDFSK